MEQKERDRIIAEKLRERQKIEAARLIKNKKKAQEEAQKKRDIFLRSFF